MEFLVRFGPGFLRTYHRAWIESPATISLAAVDEHDDIVGVLLGATDPVAHSTAMVRHHGRALAARMLAAATARPRLALDLITSRGVRYARALWRSWTRPPDPGRGKVVAPPCRTGEITHLLVAPSHQNRGVGRALVAVAEAVGRQAGLDQLVLVTPPDQAAKEFYERIGWSADGVVASRSGETFLRYHRRLTALR